MILLFNNAFMIRSVINLTFILFSNLSALGFKFRTDLLIILYHLSLATCRGEWLLRMIPSVYLFPNIYGINQQHKLKSKIIFDRSFEVIRCLYKLEDSETSLELHFWLPSHSNLCNVSRHYLKTNIYIN